MYNPNIKQKAILVISLLAVVGCIFYYIYSKNQKEEIELQNNLEIENVVEEQTKETPNNEIILVHISGAVNKEGVVELKTGSRISDAINKARGNYTRSRYKRYKFSKQTRRWNENIYSNNKRKRRK